MNIDQYRRQIRSLNLASTSNNNINIQNNTFINNSKDITNVENQEDTINIYNNYISIGTHNVRVLMLFLNKGYFLTNIRT